MSTGLDDVPSAAALRAAACELRAATLALREGGLNVVGEVLRGQGEFVEMAHYPNDDVFDTLHRAQYYYHAHRSAQDEHGHFHLFVRAPAMPAGLQSMPHDPRGEPWPSGPDAIAHLVAVSMDAWGQPKALFTTNRWVTGETLYPAAAVASLLDAFDITHASPNWAVNRWLSALVRCFRDDITALLVQRDAALAQWRQAHPEQSVYEDRRLDITSLQAIDLPARLRQLGQPLEAASF